ncbi:MAG: AAA family ATPase [Chitinispirillales bacterium]|jgi:predicted AAA+ superfamily ATPase|nr:AAA family ATPase [Chitinispirillales bacterium]
MSYIKRNVDNILLSWKTDPDRKPLLIRGARQVGKSSSIEQFGTNFEHFITVNFEKNKNLQTLFDGNLDVKEICLKLSVEFKKPIVPEKTLLFFDEIQTCPNAIMSLRYFYEDYPELHIIAAGSLLEFALEELPAFGVGRIDSLFMYPFSFQEFMFALGEELLWGEVCKSSPENPLFPAFHEKCSEALKKFLIIGGMPAAVSNFVKNNDILQVQKVLDRLILSFQNDFAKYKKKLPALLLREVFAAIVNQAGERFVYAKAAQTSLYNIKRAVNMLIMAGLVIPVYSSSANGIPLGAEVNHKKSKMLLIDTGIFQRLLDLELSDILLSNDFDVINKGSIAEQFVGLEFIKNSPPYTSEGLYFWTREKERSQAEVDYLIQNNGKIIPIEVKSGKKGKMQSMHLYLDEKKSEYGIRTSLENFTKYDNIRVLPLYAIGNVKTKNTCI